MPVCSQRDMGRERALLHAVYVKAGDNDPMVGAV
jgi:hypothetical protein